MIVQHSAILLCTYLFYSTCNVLCISAIDAGWKPGQSFSFVAKNVKGQQLKDQADVARATPIGDSYRSGSAVDWNAVDVASETMKE